MSIESMMPFNHLILCRPLLLLPPIPPSIRVFSNESTLRIRWPKYWSFSFSISPSSEHPGLMSFRMDWVDLLESPLDCKEIQPVHPKGNQSWMFIAAQFTIARTWKQLDVHQQMNGWESCDQIRSDQSLSRVRLFETPWIAVRQVSLSVTNS